jgi:CubicO group peptidase (beta-lactamase class C family)
VRWRVRVLAGVVVLGLAGYGFAVATVDRFGASRAIAWLESDPGDIHRFPSRLVPVGPEHRELPAGEPLALSTVWPGPDAEVVLQQSSTAAFLVVQDGEVRYERYFGGAHRGEPHTSFSAVKSVVSTLIGLAIAEGRIGSVHDPVTDYVPELLDRDERFAAITIEDLLTMSSGLRYDERSLPWSDDAQTYYGTRLRSTALRADIEEEPGRAFHYNNYNLLLEGLVLERATGERVSDYLASRLWQPMGAEADATWSLDSHTSGFEKMESGLNAIARDYARFGLLFADGGRVGGRQVVPEAWVAYATSGEAGPDPHYAAHWWTGTFDGRPLPDGHFAAVGKYGQLVYVAPERDAVIVRLGGDDGGVDWLAVLSEVALRL